MNLTIKYFLLATMFFSYESPVAVAQSKDVQQIDRLITPPTALASLRFLASDELKGRATARPEIQIAARYISEQFRSMQLKECPNTEDYFQRFEIKMRTPAQTGNLTIGTRTIQLGSEMLELSGGDANLQAPLVFASYGTEQDFKKANVQGKIVVTIAGYNDSSTFRQAFGAERLKSRLAKEKGAVALVELVFNRDLPWQALQQYTSQERVVPAGAEEALPSFWIKDTDHSLEQLVKNGESSVSVNVSGTREKLIPAKNVMGYVEGTEPHLKNQFIILSAHYDHLGVAKEPIMEDGKMDSIYNGARDNAVGVAAVMDAALYFSKYPPKRSVMFIAYTGEEIGEIGSKYFAAHPVIPLKQIVYNLNIDNGDYNDTTIVTVVGLGRTSADNDITKASQAFGLKAIADPAPEQDLFDRSDNVNLAEKGIPAPTFSLGFTKFDAETMKHYHHVSDEVGNMNLNYVMKYIKTFILASKHIADNQSQPTWTKGDKYEKAGEQLYGGKGGE